MSDYGNAVLHMADDGTVTVVQADETVGVARDLWDQMKPPYRREDGSLWLDTAGEWRYEFVREEPAWSRPDGGPGWDVVVFKRIAAEPGVVAQAGTGTSSDAALEESGS